MNEKRITGVWCGFSSAELMAQVHEMPVLRLTLKRVGPATCLVPWTAEYDWLEKQIKEWHFNVRRCHKDMRIAMRDLVVSLEADVGALVPGTCASIDRAEVELAIARVASGHWDGYDSPRVTAYDAKRWMSIGDTDEWLGPIGAVELQRLLTPTQLDERMRRAIDRRG